MSHTSSCSYRSVIVTQSFRVSRSVKNIDFEWRRQQLSFDREKRNTVRREKKWRLRDIRNGIIRTLLNSLCRRGAISLNNNVEPRGGDHFIYARHTRTCHGWWRWWRRKCNILYRVSETRLTVSVLILFPSFSQFRAWPILKDANTITIIIVVDENDDQLVITMREKLTNI